jgi:para-nitrobenzyl esterase
VVTVNYRLTVFGFLALPSLDEESDDSSSGNYGLLDQQAALRWVQRNIMAFGGDPHNVTIAGESAGSDNVCANLISPTAAGLFKKVIMQSGKACATATHAEVIQTGDMIATDLGCADPNTAAVCLRAKTPADLLEAAKTRAFGPNISGRALPLGLQDAVTSNQWNRSPILVGSTHDYASPVIASVGFPLSVQSYEQLVAQRFKSLAPAALNEYKLENYPDPAYAFSAENTDFERASKAAHLAKLFSDIRVMAETYQYEFDDPDAPPPSPEKTGLNIPPGFSLGSYHGSELQYLFKFSEASRDLSPTQKQLSDQMMQYWANFARTGNPNGQGLLLWPLYNPAAPLVLSFRPSGNIVIDDFDAAHHTGFWAHAQIN